MSDLIDRGMVLDKLREAENHAFGSFYSGLIKAHNIIADTPSAKPQPKRGKWIDIQEFDDCRYVKCDQCQTVQVFYYGKLNTNFCPNCGADMREVTT